LYQLELPPLSYLNCIIHLLRPPSEFISSRASSSGPSEPSLRTTSLTLIFSMSTQEKPARALQRYCVGDVPMSVFNPDILRLDKHSSPKGHRISTPGVRTKGVEAPGKWYVMSAPSSRTSLLLLRTLLSATRSCAGADSTKEPT